MEYNIVHSTHILTWILCNKKKCIHKWRTVLYVTYTYTVYTLLLICIYNILYLMFNVCSLFSMCRNSIPRPTCVKLFDTSWIDVYCIATTYRYLFFVVFNERIIVQYIVHMFKLVICSVFHLLILLLENKNAHIQFIILSFMLRIKIQRFIN